MDTKLKKSRPLLVWLCFFLGVNILLLYGIFGIASAKGIYEHIDEIKAVMWGDVKELDSFNRNILNKFEDCVEAFQNENIDSNAIAKLQKSLEYEGANLIFYSENIKTGLKLTNFEGGIIAEKDELINLPKGYDYYLYFNGENLVGKKEGKPFDISRYIDGSTLRYSDEQGKTLLERYGYAKDGDRAENIADLRIYLVVKKNLVDNDGRSTLFSIKSRAAYGRRIVIAVILFLLSAFILLGYAIFKWKSKKELDLMLVRVSSSLWLEVKAIISFMLILLAAAGRSRYMWADFSTLLLKTSAIASCGWWFYIMVMDLSINKSGFFLHNSINTAIKIYRAYEKKKPFQKSMLIRVYVLIAAEAVLVFFTGIFSLFVVAGGEGGFIFPMLFTIGVGVYLLYRYVRRYSNTIDDIGSLIDQTERIKNGDASTRLTLDPQRDMYAAAENLNQIQEGINKAIDRRIRSERMKVELITNVSHDLKTPLTSIISYVDLLSKEEDLPDHVEDYVKILRQKSDRLKVVIQDLFDVSKATSGDLDIEAERLDMGKLIRQTLADLDEQILESGLEVKVSIPEEPLFIISDGKKLYRVFQNLVTNALKYSLTGSRIYIELQSTNHKAAVVIKNTANYEMNFKEDEIMERFARGDKARSTEGSGLGLAIAQSFTQACGGSFGVKIDGDLFKAKLTFKAS